MSEEQEEEEDRYVEYFQKQLIREGSEDFLAGLNHWFNSNRSSIAEEFLALKSGHESSAQRWAAAVMVHEDRNPQDFFFSRQIFEPLLAEAISISSQLGYPLRYPVRFENSPGLEASPAALPSSGQHILFAGPGTYSFCNYWAKIFSTALYEIEGLGELSSDVGEIIEKLRQGSILIDATRLAMRYALSGSLLGFGKLPHPKKRNLARVLLLNSMEIFIVGHEIGHFINHETYPDSLGIAPDSSAKQLEFECDSIGHAICMRYGAQERNPFASELIGPLLLFFALQLSETVRQILGGPEERSESHPSHQERIEFVLQKIRSSGVEAWQRSIDEIISIAAIVSSQVEAVAVDLAKSTSAE